MPPKRKGSKDPFGPSAELFRNYCEQKRLSPQYDWTEIKQFNWNGSPGWRCCIRVVGMGEVQGTGSNKKDAQHAAMHEFISRLQARGIKLAQPKGKGATGPSTPSWAIHGPSVLQSGPPKKQQRPGESQGPARPPARPITSEMASMLSHLRSGNAEKALEVAQKQFANETNVMSVKQLATLVTAVGVRAKQAAVLSFFEGLLTMEVVDFPNASARTYFSRFSRWAMMEFLAEGKSCAEEASTMIPQLLERNGTCIQLLNVAQGNSGTELQLLPPNGQLPDRHGFQRGDYVFITSPHNCQVQLEGPTEGQEGVAMTLEGELTAFTPPPHVGMVVKVVGSGGALAQKFVGGTCRVDRAANHVTFGRQVHALHVLCTEPGDLDWLSLALMAAEAEGEFEKVAEYCGNPPPTGGFQPNQSILASANASQFEALKAATNRRLTLIQGPPGAGKTSTAIMLMRMWVGSGRRPVLATADSNIAVDNLVSGCAGAAMKVVRVGRRGASRPDLDGYNLFDKARAAGGPGGERFNWKAEKKILEAADVVCCTCSGAEHPALHGMTFANVLVDEAAQTTELATLVPFLHLKAEGCAVLVGDHRQLPATVACLEADVEGLGTSLFERLANLGVQPMLLDTQYRMHPSLAIFPSQQYYGGRLRSGIRGTARRAPKGIQWPIPEAPIAFLPVQGQEIPEGNSYTNTAEANSILELLGSVLNGRDLSPGSIGVITPYAAQARLLRNFLGIQGGKQAQSAAQPEVSSVDGFQGREKDLILVSTVRANKAGKVGFVGNFRRLNVTLTRARRGLVVVGDFSTLSQDAEGWRPWLSWAQERGLIVGCDATEPEAMRQLQRLELLTEQELLAMGPADAPRSLPTTGGGARDALADLPGQAEPNRSKPRQKSMLMQIREEVERTVREQEAGGAQAMIPTEPTVESLSPWATTAKKEPKDPEVMELEEEQLPGQPDTPSVLSQLRVGDASKALEVARRQCQDSGNISLEHLVSLLVGARLQPAGEAALQFLEGVLAAELVAFQGTAAADYFGRFGGWVAQEFAAAAQAEGLEDARAPDKRREPQFEVSKVEAGVVHLVVLEGRLQEDHGLQEGDRLLIASSADPAAKLEADLRSFLPGPEVGVLAELVGPPGDVAQRLFGGPCRVERCVSHAAFRRQLEALLAFCADPEGLEWLSSGLLAAEGLAAACASTPTSGGLELNAQLASSADSLQLEVLEAAADRRLTLVQGPAGTGKTFTAVLLLRQWVAAGRGPVLATAGSGVAVDNLVSACARAGLKVVRLGVEEASRPELGSYRLSSKALAAGVLPSSQLCSWKGSQRMLESADVVCCLCTSADDPVLQGMKFKFVLIDDAAQVTEPASLVPLLHLQPLGCAVLLGDLKQLPTATSHPEADVCGLGVSLYERLASLGVEPLPLRVQHRMHPCLADFPCQACYEGQLQPGVCGSLRSTLEGIKWPLPEVPIAFLPVKGQESDAHSNEAEAAAVVEVLSSALLAGDLHPSEVGIITPEPAQVHAIRSLIREQRVPGISEAEVGGIEAFQGREKELVLVSAVRTRSERRDSFAGDVGRLNVMLTRARRGLVICGSFDTLAEDADGWRLWLCWAQERGLVAGCDATVPPAAAALHRLATLPLAELLSAQELSDSDSEDGVLEDVPAPEETPAPKQKQEMPAPEATPAPSVTMAPEQRACEEIAPKEAPQEAAVEPQEQSGPAKRRRLAEGPEAVVGIVLAKLGVSNAIEAALEELRGVARGSVSVGQLCSTLVAAPLATSAEAMARLMDSLEELGLVDFPSTGAAGLFYRLGKQALLEFLAAPALALEDAGSGTRRLQVSHVVGRELHLVPLSSQLLQEGHGFRTGDRLLLTSPPTARAQLAGHDGAGCMTLEANLQSLVASPKVVVIVELLAETGAEELAGCICRVDRAGDRPALCRRLQALQTVAADLGDLAWLGPALLSSGAEEHLSEELVAACASAPKNGGFHPNSRVLSSASAHQFEALRAATTRKLTLIQGPAGTGKTLTATLLAQLWVSSGRGPVLAVAAREAAVGDLVAGCEGAGLKVVCLDESKARSLAKRARASGSPHGEEGGWEAERTILAAVDVVCCSCAEVAHPAFQGSSFAGVLVDGDASEAAALLPLLCLRADGCAALLGERVRSGSLLGQLAGLGVQPLVLEAQYRMHPALAAFPAEWYHAGLLRSGVLGSARRALEGIVWPVPEAAIAFLPLAGQERVEGSSFSNFAEAAAVADLVDAALEAGDVRASEIGIITEYTAQARMLCKLLALTRVDVGSVNTFEGREKDLILVSTVRTGETAEPLANSATLHVTLTRARRGLVVCGDFSALARDVKGWRPWLNWAQRRGVVAGCAATSKVAAKELRRLGGLSEAELLMEPAGGSHAPKRRRK